MTESPDLRPPRPPGRALSGRAATAAGVALGLLLVVLVGTALAVTRGGPAEDPVEPVHEDHLEVDPLTDRPLVDPCVESPQMCGEDAGAGSGPCDEAAMCGSVTPGTDEEEIDADTGPCSGELCGDIGPGEDDGAGA